MRLHLFDLFVVVLSLGIAGIAWKRVKLLGKIQILFTLLLVFVFFANIATANWLHSMAYADPVRQEWQTKLNSISGFLWFGTLIPWLLFTIFHLVQAAKERVERKNQNETTSRIS